MVWGKRRSTTPQVQAQSVWIVRDEEPELRAILGVFGTRDESVAFAKEISDQFHDGVTVSEFRVGYRHDRGSGFVTFGPDGAT